MSIFVIDIFEAVQIQITKRGLLFVPQKDLHVFFKEQTVLDSGAGVVVCLAGKVMRHPLLFGNVDDNMYIGGALLQLNRERGDSIVCIVVAAHFPYAVLFFAAPFQKLRMEGKTALAGVAEALVCHADLLSLIAV